MGLVDRDALGDLHSAPHSQRLTSIICGVSYKQGETPQKAGEEGENIVKVGKMWLPS